MKILVFGNPLVEEDSLPLKLLPRLQERFPEIEFKDFDSVEDLQDEGRDLVIIDTVKGINKVQLIEDIDSFVLDKVYSLHDFDLGYNLKLMKKAGMLDSVKIIGIPDSFNEKEIFRGLYELIKSNSLSGNG